MSTYIIEPTKYGKWQTRRSDAKRPKQYKYYNRDTAIGFAFEIRGVDRIQVMDARGKLEFEWIKR